MLAIIGGTGLARLAGLQDTRREVVRTPYGDPSCAVTFGRLGGTPIVFLARHGYGHTIAPHEINYRANLWALQEVGVERVIAVATVGGIRGDCAPGALVVPDQIIDYTSGRHGTYFEGAEQPVTHIDFTEPYDAEMRQRLVAAAQRVQRPVIDGATYGCTQGPRLETAAEIGRLERDGCCIVGMTGMPEAALARELQLRYAALCVVANHAAGKGSSRTSISLEGIQRVLDQAMESVRMVLEEAVARA
ncbi:MAG TPA: S-methyl-5'-thioinosine phosphorylase [Zeimonas sp.]|nr:S-methyl-5'-thioinosine phosphorylase [Zeimonas sp.]